MPKPGSCTDFIQCFNDDGHIKLEVGQCPIGSHFDERFIMCRPSYREMCISGNIVDRFHSNG